MKMVMWSSMSAILALAMALSVTSSPALLTARDDENIVVAGVGVKVDTYTQDDGSLDLGALIDDSAVTPIEVPATATAPTFLTFPTAALLASAAADVDIAYTTTLDAAAAEQTDAAAKKRDVPAGTKGQGGVVAAWDSSFCRDTTPGPGPVLNPTSADTPENFRNSGYLRDAIGQGPGTQAPDGYTKVWGPLSNTATLTTHSASLGIDPTYTSYNPAKCAATCNRNANCRAIIFWLQRDTDIDYYSSSARANNLQTRCNNPPHSRTNYVCALYSAAITADQATNAGQYKGPIFKTAHNAVNAYVKNNIVVPIDGYTTQVNQAGIIDNGYTHQFLIDIITPNNNPQASGYVPQLCASNCNGRADCAGFDSTSLYRDGKFSGTLCNLYSMSFNVAEQPAKAGQYTPNGYVSSQPAIFYTKTVA